MEIDDVFNLIQKIKMFKMLLLYSFKLDSFELRKYVLVLFFKPRKSFSGKSYKFSKYRKYWIEMRIMVNGNLLINYCKDLENYLKNKDIIKKIFVKKLRKLCE